MKQHNDLEMKYNLLMPTWAAVKYVDLNMSFSYRIKIGEE
jgi:hypothetical protein